MANVTPTILPAPTEQAWKDAAKKWHKTLLMMPHLAMGESVKFLTGLPGCRTNQLLGGYNVDAQFYPYAANKRGDASLAITYEELEMFFGAMNIDFVPNDYVQTFLGEHGSTLGNGMTQTEFAKLLLGQIMAAAGENLSLALFDAERNANGTTTMELFNGFNTITEANIADGKVSRANNNLVEFDVDIDAANVVDALKTIEFGLDQRLRRQQRFIYCDPALVDLYNEGYQLTHTTLPYNKQYNQPIVEGSNGRLTFAPMDGLAGSKLMYIAPKMNMIYGYDSMSDLERLEVLRLDVDTLTAAAKMFFGVQFRTLDFRFLKVVKFKNPIVATAGDISLVSDPVSEPVTPNP